jgi:hypothetical protein
MNGKKGDDPILDIVHWKEPRFSPEIDSLIAQIVQLGGRDDLERKFNLSKPPAPEQFEESLRNMRDTLKKDRKERGWEI